MNVIEKLAIAVALTCVVASPLMAQRPGADQDQAIKVEVKAAFDQYYEWYSAGRADLVAERAYQAPTLRLTPSGPEVSASTDALRAYFEALLKPLIADGLVRTEMPNPSICVLNDTAALVSGRYVRYRKDGSVIDERGGLYMLTKASGAWRVVSFVSHNLRNGISCSD